MAEPINRTKEEQQKDRDEYLITGPLALEACHELLKAIRDGKLDSAGTLIGDILDVCTYVSWKEDNFDAEETHPSYELWDKASDQYTVVLKRLASNLLGKLEK